MWLAAPSTSALSSSCLLQTNPLATPWHLLVPSWRSQLPSCSQPLAPAFSPSVSPQLQVDLAGGRSGNWHGVRIDLRVLLYLPAIGCGNQREKVSEPWRELLVLLTSGKLDPTCRSTSIESELAALLIAREHHDRGPATDLRPPADRPAHRGASRVELRSRNFFISAVPAGRAPDKRPPSSSGTWLQQLRCRGGRRAALRAARRG